MKTTKSSSGNSSDIKKKPLVSVIIPTWNRAHMIKNALDSVFSQDYPNLEVIVVDDGSTDAIREALSPYPDVFPFLLSKHTGQCSARNFGLNEAHGKYIQLLDSDDALLPGAIKKHVEFLEAHPDIDLVYGDLVTSNNFIMDHPHIKQSSNFKPDVRKGTPIDFDMKKTLIKNLQRPLDFQFSILYLYVPGKDYLHISTGTSLFRKNKIRYDPVIEKNWDCSADVDFWGQLIMAGFKFAYLPGSVFEWRSHSDNLTNRAGMMTEERWGVREYIYKKLKAQIKEDESS